MVNNIDYVKTIFTAEELATILMVYMHDQNLDMIKVNSPKNINTGDIGIKITVENENGENYIQIKLMRNKDKLPKSPS